MAELKHTLRELNILRDAVRSLNARDALYAAIAALSHAAGQEVVCPHGYVSPLECVGCQKLKGAVPVAWQCWTYHGGWEECTKELHDHIKATGRYSGAGSPVAGARELYLTPAQPPASAEVVDLLRRTVLAFRYVYDESCTAGVLRKDIERYLASSGRKESPIDGVTHGTDEGWGDLGPQGTHTQRQG